MSCLFNLKESCCRHNCLLLGRARLAASPFFWSLFSATLTSCYIQLHTEQRDIRVVFNLSSNSLHKSKSYVPKCLTVPLNKYIWLHLFPCYSVLWTILQALVVVSLIISWLTTRLFMQLRHKSLFRSNAIFYRPKPSKHVISCRDDEMIMKHHESDIWQMDCIHLYHCRVPVLLSFDKTWNTSSAQIFSLWQVF